MIRVEFKSKHSKEGRVFCESTQEDAEAYVQLMRDVGIEFDYINYYDEEQRLADIREGKD